MERRAILAARPRGRFNVEYEEGEGKLRRRFLRVF
jgi:hypothetical protein